MGVLIGLGSGGNVCFLIYICSVCLVFVFNCVFINVSSVVVEIGWFVKVFM